MIIAGIAVFGAVGGWYMLQPKGNAPDFSLTDLEGNSLRLRDFRGKVVLLDFMATWCGPCALSMPVLHSIHSEYGNRIVMISIGMDPMFDTEERLQHWVNYWEAAWIHARDIADPPVAQLYEAMSIPKYVIIDEKGDIRFTYVGYRQIEEILSREISSLLEE